jgi:hypothetical protein
MLRNRYNRTDLFALVPQLGLRFEPQLEQLDRLLDDDELFEAVRADLARRHPKTRSRGRPSTPVEVVLRMLVVMRLTAGATPRPNTSSTTAWCCASSAASTSSVSPTTPR